MTNGAQLTTSSVAAPLTLSFVKADIDKDTDTVTKTGHGLATGDAVTYRADTAGAFPGLVDGETYFVVKVDNDKFKLAHTRDQARRVAATLTADQKIAPVDLGDPAANDGTGSLTRVVVLVDAQANYQAVDLAGLSTVLSIFGREADASTEDSPQEGAKSDGAAVGVSYIEIDRTNIATATIDDGVTVTLAAGDLLVNADARGFTLAVAEAGAKAKSVGLSGTVTMVGGFNTATARIENGATVAARHVLLDATATLTHVIIAGSIQKDPGKKTTGGSGSAQGGGAQSSSDSSENDFGFGISIAINDLTNTARAAVEDDKRGGRVEHDHHHRRPVVARRHQRAAVRHRHRWRS